jgi:uncharacterized protein (TIRG00374 family)
MNKNKIGRTLLSLSGIIIFGIIIYLGGKDAILRVLQGDPIYVLGTLTSIGGITLVGALRWRLLVIALTGKPLVSLRQIYHYNILGRLISLFAPRGIGDFAGRPIALRTGIGSPLGIAFYSTVLDRLFDYIIMSILIVPAFFYATRIISVRMGAVFSLVFIVLFYFMVTTRFGQVIRWFNRVLGKIADVGYRVPIINKLLSHERVNRFRELEDIEIDSRTTSGAYLLTVLQFTLVILRSYLAAQAMNLDLPYLLLLMASPIAQLGQLLAFTPGALGFRELGWISVLQASGIARDDLLTFLVGHRAYIYVSILVLAAISQLITMIWPVPKKDILTPVEAERQET